VGVPAFLQTLQGAGHVPYTQYQSLMFSQSDYFFYWVLDLAHAQGQPAAARQSFEAQAQGVAEKYPRYAARMSERYPELAR
jgi:hypothetical protein